VIRRRAKKNKTTKWLKRGRDRRKRSRNRTLKYPPKPLGCHVRLGHQTASSEGGTGGSAREIESAKISSETPWLPRAIAPTSGLEKCEVVKYGYKYQRVNMNMCRSNLLRPLAFVQAECSNSSMLYKKISYCSLIASGIGLRFAKKNILLVPEMYIDF